MTQYAGRALALLTLALAGPEALAQTRPWPTDPPPPQQQTAPWPGSPPPAQQQAAPWPSKPPQQPPQQQTAPWPGNAPPQPAMMAPAPPMGAPPGGDGAGGAPPPCVAKFMGHRDKVEKAAAAAKAASERKATREEMCKHVTAYFNAETQWIKYTKESGTSCGIPAQILKQLETVHGRTGAMRKQICAAGPAGAGPAAPSLSDALGTSTLPAPETTRTGRGTFDTLTGNALKR